MIDFTGRDAFGAGAGAVYFDADLRDGDLGFEVYIGEAGDGQAGFFDLCAEATEGFEVRALDFHGDFCGDAAEHVAEAVADGLADVDEGAGDRFEFIADFGEDDIAGAAIGVELDIELVDRDRHDVVIAFGATGAASDGFHFGDFQ